MFPIFMAHKNSHGLKQILCNQYELLAYYLKKLEYRKVTVYHTIVNLTSVNIVLLNILTKVICMKYLLLLC